MKKHETSYNPEKGQLRFSFIFFSVAVIDMISPTAWQPATWILFHHVAKNYKEEYTPHYVAFFETFKTIIPCRICRTHYIEKLNEEKSTSNQKHSSF